MTGKTILLVEDNSKVMRNNITMLKSHGAKVLAAENIAKARLLLAEKPDAAVIDIMLPDGSGLSLLEEIRGSSGAISSLPVLLLTAMGENSDIVKGLNIGADDYLAKPYDLNILEARICALLRRTEGARTRTIADNLHIGSISLEMLTNKAVCNGNNLELTPKEFAMLFLLVQNEGKALSAKLLYEKVWNMKYDKNNTTIRGHIKNLKKKLDSITDEIIIESSRGEGYFLRKI